MPEFQLPIAVALATSAAVSSIAYVFDHGKDEGKIKLVDDGTEGEYDPFAVTTPGDVADGEPLDEAAFWAQVRVELIARSFCVPERERDRLVSVK
jgi:hypothetical protein